jgi:hypothetical protein
MPKTSKKISQFEVPDKDSLGSDKVVVAPVEDETHVAKTLVKVKKTRKPRVKKVAKADGDKPVKAKKAPSAYCLFVKAKYPSVRDLPVKDRFKQIALLWKEEKAKKTSE